MTLPSTLTEHLRTDLLGAIESQNQRRRTRRRVAVAAPVVAATIAAGSALLIGSSADPAYAISGDQDGTIRVSINPDFDDVEALKDDLEDRGLAVQIIHLKGHPSLDGVVEVASHQNQESGAFEFAGREFEIDVAKVEGEVEILIYTAAVEGQPYQFAPSIFAPDQPLAAFNCSYEAGPMPVEDLEEHARAAGIDDFAWLYFENFEPGQTGTEPEERPDGFVASAQLADQTTLRVTVVPESLKPAAETLSMGDGTHYRSHPTC